MSIRFSSDERYVMQAELERNGGVFEGNMLYDHTDYLIVRNIYSEKYRIALEWGNIILVNEYWFQDSVRCNSSLCFPLTSRTSKPDPLPKLHANPRESAGQSGESVQSARSLPAGQADPHVVHRLVLVARPASGKRYE